MEQPSREFFMEAPREALRGYAPATIALAPGGTRRQAALAGLSMDHPDFPRWSRRQAIALFERLFDYGAQNLIWSIVVPTNWQELTPAYREHFNRWAAWCMAGDEALADYTRNGWRVRALGANLFPEETGIPAVTEILAAETSGEGPKSLILQAIPSHEALYNDLIQLFKRPDVTTWHEAIQALVGFALEPATMHISFGKVVVAPSYLHPLLMDTVACYWSQRPGYDLDDNAIRALWYDKSVARQTFMADKTNRELLVKEDPDYWLTGPITGLGERVGPFWRPGNDRPVRGGRSD